MGFGSFGASSFGCSISICILLERRFIKANIYCLFEFCKFTCQLYSGRKLCIAGVSNRIKAAIYGYILRVIRMQGTCVVPLLQVLLLVQAHLNYGCGRHIRGYFRRELGSHCNCEEYNNSLEYFCRTRAKRLGETAT